MKTLVTKASMVAAVAVGLDQVSKLVARGAFEVCSSTPFERCDQLDLGSFGFARVENAGSAMGFEQGLPVWVIMAVLGLLMLPLYGSRLSSFGTPAALAIGLQAGGAAGNLLDRLILGGVTDFVVIANAMVINVADLELLAGMVLASALMLRSPTKYASRSAASTRLS